MIKEVENHISKIYPNMTYGQIADSPDNLFNLRIYENVNKPFFSDDKTHVLSINLFIRDVSFENMQSNNEIVNDSLNKLYDISIPGYHIVDTNLKGSSEPQRDIKNRYSVYSNYEMLIEEV